MKNSIVGGKRIGVIGLARSGIAAANLAAAKGAKVLVSEAKTRAQSAKALAGLRKGVEAEFGGHSKRLLDSDIIVKSPGVHKAGILADIQKRGIPVWSEIELALRLTGRKCLVAITGTNGKTTTTALTGGIFKAAGRKTVVGGNIGAPLASLARSVNARTTLVLELSSYQLEDSPTIHPDVSCILNITPDHLEHHGTMKNYAGAKARIFARQTRKDFCVLNHDDAWCRKLAKSCPGRVVFFSRRKKLRDGVHYADNKIVVRLPFMKAEMPAELAIPGMHNIENALASVAMAVCGGVPVPVIRKVLKRFPGVEHRIEFAGEINGARYYNDSKATNVDSTRVALESFPGNIWLILGGRDKGAPYSPLAGLVRKRVKGIFLIGEAAGKIRKGLAGSAPMHDCGTIKGALSKARALARPGDIVLLSPACASFDQFTDYEERGGYFKSLVKELQ